jgi:transcriptional regulator GlxA family with amidase domain
MTDQLNSLSPPLPERSWPRRVAVLLFDDVEVLDFAGPFEVFGVARTEAGTYAFEVFTVALERTLVSARNDLRILPHVSTAQAGRIDVLVIPGGYGTRREMHNEALLGVVRELSRSADLTLSVCTGALVLGAAGLLHGLAATTHYGAMDELRALDCAVVLPDARIVDNGHLITSAGVTAGIDAALHVVGRLIGDAAAAETARYMQYDWRAEAVEPS